MKNFVAAFEGRFFPVRFLNLLLLAFMGGCFGFTLGTEVLLGPVGWITSRARAAGWSPASEDGTVKLIIAALVFTTLLAGLYLTRAVVRSRRIDVRFGLPLLLLICATGTLYFWINPGRFGPGLQGIAGGKVAPRFTIGPYPTAEDMQRLKRLGYTSVISLLHPAVVPFETALIDEERKNAAETGIEFIHLPMLPWISKNTEVLNRMEELVRSGKGNYYVHCYLGKDRVNTIRRLIEETGGQMRNANRPSKPASDSRSLREIGAIERGQVQILDHDVYLIPLPTDEEYLSYILSNPDMTVVSLLDPAVPDNVQWIEKERGVMADYKRGYHEFPISENEIPVASQAVAAVEFCRKMPRPLAIHAFKHPSTVSTAFALAWPAGTGMTAIVRQEPQPPRPAGRARIFSMQHSFAPPLPAVISAGSISRYGLDMLVAAAPSPAMIILLGPFCLFYTLLAASLAGWLRNARKWPAPYTRKVFHFSIFTMASIVNFAGGLQAVALFGTVVATAVLYAVLRSDGFPFYEAMARPTDAPHKSFFIIVPLLTTAAGGILSNIFFGGFAAIGYLVGGWGDAVGEPVGSRWGRHRFRVPSLLGVKATRSIEGSSAVFIVSALAAYLGLAAAGLPHAQALRTAIACAAAGTAVEAVSTHGLDNLTMQLTGAGMAWWLLT